MVLVSEVAHQGWRGTERAAGNKKGGKNAEESKNQTPESNEASCYQQLHQVDHIYISVPFSRYFTVPGPTLNSFPCQWNLKSFLVLGIFLSHNKTQSHSPATIDFAVKLSASEGGIKIIGLTSHQVQQMSCTLRKPIILITALQQQITRWSLSPCVFRVLS